MEEFSFTGLGTTWSVAVDDEVLRKEVQDALLAYIRNFENRFSRFLPQSEVNAFRKSPAGDFIISKEFAVLLARADKLRALTDGAYDPAVGSVLEEAGYGAELGMEKIDGKHIPVWSLSGETLTLDGPIAFDLGGIGKGFCIDRVAEVLTGFGYHYFLVEGGGDMVGTIKGDGSAWRVAIEYPGKSDTAASLVQLSHQGVAVSDIFRRRFGKWHHLIDIQGRKPIEKIIGVASVARDAFSADCMTSGLFFAPTEQYALLAREFEASFIVFRNDGTAEVSANWKGEILSSES